MQQTTDRKDPPATRKAAPRFDPRTSCRPSPTTDSSACVAENEGVDVSIWDCGSSLYDSYEIVSFFNLLDRGLITPAPAAAADHTSSSNCNGGQKIPCNPTCSSKFIVENVNLRCKCNKLKKHRFRWFFRLAFNISRSVALWASDEECPRHRPFKADYGRKGKGDSVLDRCPGCKDSIKPTIKNLFKMN